MEHENGSGRERAAPSPPDELSSPRSFTAAEPSKTEEPVSAAEPSEPRELVESESFAPAAASEPTADSDIPDAEGAAKTWQATGEPRVDAALGRLSELDELPVSEHPGVYERVHEQLVDVLGELHPGTRNR
jgi:hypothetical protein